MSDYFTLFNLRRVVQDGRSVLVASVDVLDEGTSEDAARERAERRRVNSTTVTVLGPYQTFYNDDTNQETSTVDRTFGPRASFAAPPENFFPRLRELVVGGVDV